MLPLSVYGYFANGGSIAYIGRVPNTEPAGRARHSRSAGRRPRARTCRRGRVDRARRRPHRPGRPPTTPATTPPRVPTPFTHHDPRGRHGRGDLLRPHPRRRAQRRDHRQRHLDQDQGRGQARQRRRPGKPARAAQARRVPAREGRAAAGAGHRPQVRRLRVGPHRHQRPGHRRGRHDGDRPRPGHRRHRGGRHDRPQPVEGRADRADLPLRAARATGWPSSTRLPACRRSRSRSGAATSRMYDSAFAALYYPWIKVENPTGTNGDTEILVPPSGHVAGVWARTDDTRGVWKAPANDTMRGVLDVERTDHPERAVRCSTRSASTASAPSAPAASASGAPAPWPRTPTGTYINVRRLFNMVEATILERHPVGGVRAQRHGAVGGREAHRQRVPPRPVAGRRAVRRDRRRGVLRQVRRRDQPARVDRPGQARRRGRHRAGQAGGVRDLPHQPEEAGRRPDRVRPRHLTARRPHVACPTTSSQPTRSSPRTSTWRSTARTSSSSSRRPASTSSSTSSPSSRTAPTAVQQVVKTRGNTQKAPDLHAHPDGSARRRRRTRSGSGSSRSATRACTVGPGQRTARTARSSCTTRAYVEVGRFNFFNGWPSKIATDR